MSVEATLTRWVEDFFPQKQKGKTSPCRLVLFIDDLDRCLPEVTLEILEALKLYLNIPGLAFAVGLDRSVVDEVVTGHYKQHSLNPEKAEHYLDKMFQVEVDISPAQVQVRDYLAGQVKRLDEVTSGQWNEHLKNAGDNAKELIRKAIERLSLDNPREVKRLLNSTFMRASAAQRNATLKGKPVHKHSEALRFAQGAQVYLVGKFLVRAFGPGTDAALRYDKVLEYLERCSQFVRDNPDYKALQDRTEEKSSGKVHQGEEVASSPGTDADQAYEQLQRDKPQHNNNQLDVLNDPNLPDLLKIPFSKDVAASTATTQTVHERTVIDGFGLGDSATAQSAQKPQPQDLSAFPPQLLTRIARSLDKPVEKLVLSDLSGLTKLDLSGTDINDERMKHLAKLTALHTLSLTKTSVSDQGIIYLAGLTALQRLWLDDTKVSDQGISHLAGLTALQWLGLSNTQVGDQGISHLAGLTALQRLDLDGTQVGDLGISHLAGLTALQGLDLNNTQVGDLGISHLAGLTALQWLGLSNSPVTDEGESQLHKALPKCRIVR